MQLGLCMFQLECLVQEQMPDLFTHFNNMGFDTSMYASSWFLTLFTTTLPLELANRIMDVFLAEGMEIIFRLAMAILQQARIDLLKLDMEGMLKYFQRDVRERFENDHELLFAVAYNVTLNAKKMKRLEKDYLAKRTKEQEEAIELRAGRRSLPLGHYAVQTDASFRTAGRTALPPPPPPPVPPADPFCTNISSAAALGWSSRRRIASPSVHQPHHSSHPFPYSVVMLLMNNKRKVYRRFRWTKKRLRTENRLLRQRIEYLEQESAALADRLIRGQVTLAQEAENCINISHEMHKLRDMNSDAHRRLEEAYETIRELSCRKHDTSTEKEIQVDDTTMIEHIHSLQQEMIETNAREADNENTIRDLKQRIQELEAANKRLKETPPDHCVATLQEELISVKMREAEASLSLKEMRQRLAELEGHWAKYIHMRCFENGSGTSDRRASIVAAGPGPEVPDKDKPAESQQQQSVQQTARGRLAKLTASLMGTSVDAGDASSSPENNNGISVKELEDQLMGIRIREADTVAELKEMRQKVMELETQNHVCTNQLKRQDQELKRMREEREGVLQKEKDVNNLLRDEQRKTIEALSQIKEQSVMARLKETEAMQTIADLKQKIAELELKKAEKWTHSQLRGSSICDMDDDSLSIPGSRSQSIVSGDALSIGSESADFNALIADMTVRLPDDLRTTHDKLLPDTGDDTATETDDSPRSQRVRHSSGENTVIVVDSSADDSGVLLSPGAQSR
uniref:Rab-GAP TBC domain-containing protein n=2 Tax=Plectus sambesii TaxID=2011161 RepID=A0A914WJC5_9BILA